MEPEPSPTEDGDQEEKPYILLDNIHKTYLLGIEGITALRSELLTFSCPP
jgi:hypothetical protein